MISSLIRAFNKSSSWQLATGSLSNTNFTTVVQGTGKIIAGGGSMFESTTGDTWVSLSTPPTATALYPYCSAYSGVAYVFAGYSYNTGAPLIYSSTDGITWTSRSATGFGSTSIIVGVYWSGTYFVAISSQGHIATSSNTGATWTQRAKETTFGFTCGAYGNGVYIASGGALYTSTNGTTWTNRAATAPGVVLSSVTYGNSKFVGVGASGGITTSTDGITWTSPINPVTTNLNGITYGGSKFVAVGTSGVILTSLDGITWIKVESPVTTNLQKVIYTGSKFVAVGNSGKILTSITGL